jgi:hypothetical protein
LFSCSEKPLSAGAALKCAVWQTPNLRLAPPASIIQFPAALMPLRIDAECVVLGYSGANEELVTNAALAITFYTQKIGGTAVMISLNLYRIAIAQFAMLSK